MLNFQLLLKLRLKLLLTLSWMHLLRNKQENVLQRELYSITVISTTCLARLYTKIMKEKMNNLNKKRQNYKKKTKNLGALSILPTSTWLSNSSMSLVLRFIYRQAFLIIWWLTLYSFSHFVIMFLRIFQIVPLWRYFRIQFYWKILVF